MTNFSGAAKGEAPTSAEMSQLDAPFKVGLLPDCGGKMLMIAAPVALAFLGYAAIERPAVRWRRGLPQSNARP